jgi:hypothetical protein
LQPIEAFSSAEIILKVAWSAFFKHPFGALVSTKRCIWYKLGWLYAAIVYQTNYKKVFENATE